MSFFRVKKLYCHTLYFSLIIVKSLQLGGHRKIAEPCKYCLVRVIVFFDVCFLYLFCFSQVGILVKIPYNWYHSLGLGLSGSNGRRSRKGIWNRKVRWHKLWILEDVNRGLSLWEEVASTASREKICNYEG